MNPAEITIRHDLRPGDAGYIIYLHGWIYAQEYNYSTVFEAYVAKSFYDFLIHYDPAKDRLWVAEHDQKIVGCVGIVDRGERAQLRWFLLHPDARGIGLGKRLLQSAIDYCRARHFKTIYLATTDDLTQAIGMYTKAGFVQTTEKPNEGWRANLKELEFEMRLEE